MKKGPICCKCKKKRATSVAPAKLCKKCWYEWWNSSDDDDGWWEKLFVEECGKKPQPTAPI